MPFIDRKCKFCNELPDKTMIRYGVTHYAHLACYEKTGKPLEKLQHWEVPVDEQPKHLHGIAPPRWSKALCQWGDCSDMSLAVSLKFMGSRETFCCADHAAFWLLESHRLKHKKLTPQGVEILRKAIRRDFPSTASAAASDGTNLGNTR